MVANVHHPLDVDVANGLREVRSVGGRIKRIAWYPWHMQHAVARRLDALITGSRASAALIERLWKLPPGLMHPIYDGVDLDAFHPGATDEMEPGALLFVGNSEDYNKGVVYLLRAMAELPASTRTHLYSWAARRATARRACRDRAARHRRPRDDRRAGAGARAGGVVPAGADRWYRRRCTRGSGCRSRRRWRRGRR